MSNSLNKEFQQNTTIVVKTFLRKNCILRFLECTRSLYKDIHIIVCDDSDGDFLTEKEINLYRVEYHILPFDTGLSKGRNYLVSKVSTPYFFLFDDDVVLEPNAFLENCYRVITENKFDIVFPIQFESDRFVPNEFKKEFLVETPCRGIIDKREDLWMPTRGPHREIINGYKIYDFTHNSILCDRNFFIKHNLKWDDEVKIGGEHMLFYLEAKRKICDIKIAMCEDSYVLNKSMRPTARYLKYRYRKKFRYGQLKNNDVKIQFPKQLVPKRPIDYKEEE